VTATTLFDFLVARPAERVPTVARRSNRRGLLKLSRRRKIIETGHTLRFSFRRRDMAVSKGVIGIPFCVLNDDDLRWLASVLPVRRPRGGCAV